jgi:coenzyme PQQ precursor peptide PqqA
MAWKTPTILEVQVGMEINMYTRAAYRQLRQHARLESIEVAKRTSPP